MFLHGRGIHAVTQKNDSMERFRGVADTLYIPLVARMSVSRKYPDYFLDTKTLELESQLPAHWKGVMAHAREYEEMAAVARYVNLDVMTRGFMERFGECNVVQLGAGLDTAYYRLRAGGVRFYEVDLPPVIELRRRILGESADDTCLGGDMFDLQWTTHVDVQLPTLLVASGVFQYFSHEKLEDFVRQCGRIFPVSELIFDATTRFGIMVANHYVRRLGNREAHMSFYVDRPGRFARRTGARLIECRPFFRDTRRMLGARLKTSTLLLMLGSDCLRMAKLLHLRLNTSP